MRVGTNKRTSDVLSIVEAAYSLEEPQKQWAQRLLEEADQCVGRGLAGFACTFDANSTDGTVAIDRRSAAIINQPVETVHAIFDGLTQAAPGWLSTYFAGEGGAPRCLLTSRRSIRGENSTTAIVWRGPASTMESTSFAWIWIGAVCCCRSPSPRGRPSLLRSARTWCAPRRTSNPRSGCGRASPRSRRMLRLPSARPDPALPC